MVDDVIDCVDCLAHESGCCWSHKMQHIRGNPNLLSVPAAFKQDQTNREIRDEIYAGARAAGRDITRAK